MLKTKKTGPNCAHNRKSTIFLLSQPSLSLRATCVSFSFATQPVCTFPNPWKLGTVAYFAQVPSESEWLIQPAGLEVARNEVKNASLAQRSSHRDSRIWWPELIDSAAQRKWLAQLFTSTQVVPSRPIVFGHSAIFHPSTPHNVWFSESADIFYHFTKNKMETFSSRFLEIPGNVWKMIFRNL